MRCRFAIAVLLLAGCGGSPPPQAPASVMVPAAESVPARMASNLPDVRYGYEGDVVGVTTLAQFREKYSGGVKEEAVSPYFREIGVERFKRSFSDETKQPLIGGFPAEASYTFLKGVLESISIIRKFPEKPGEFASYEATAKSVEDAGKEMFGPPANVLPNEVDWETRHSTVIATRGLDLMLIQDNALSVQRNELMLKDPALVPLKE